MFPFLLQIVHKKFFRLRTVSLKAKSAACLDSLGWVYYKLGMYKDAKKYLEMAEQLEPKNQEIAEHLRILMVDGENKNEN